MSADLKTKIWNGEYVPFWDLLHPDLEGPSDLQPREPGKSQKKVLSGAQWHRAFLCYVGIRVAKFPQEVDELLRYGGFIGELIEQRVDWALYDSRFRWDKATDPAFHNTPWSQIRQQLVNEAYLNQEGRAGGGAAGQSLFRANPTGIPTGFCFRHHEGGSSDCTSRSCSFNHRCPLCLEKHPLHQHQARHASRRQSPRRKRDQPANSAYAHKEKRRR